MLNLGFGWVDGVWVLVICVWWNESVFVVEVVKYRMIFKFGMILVMVGIFC